LSFAWFAFATPATKLQYQDCEIDSRRMSHRLDMEIQVLDNLKSGKLLAWGVREGASLDEGPTLIPSHLSPRDGDDTAAVDWGTVGFEVIRFYLSPNSRHETAAAHITKETDIKPRIQAGQAAATAKRSTRANSNRLRGTEKEGPPACR
jgi:hypothetical protein